MKRNAFTLIELLVVISIITLLVSILLPSLSKVRLYAKQVVCSTNLKSIGTGFVMYQDENHDLLPETLNFPAETIDERDESDGEVILVDVMEKYIVKEAWKCPADDQNSFGKYGTSYDYLPGGILSMKDALAGLNIDAQALVMQLITEGDDGTLAGQKPGISEEDLETIKTPLPLVIDKGEFHPTSAMPKGRQALFYDSSIELVDFDKYSSIFE